MLNDCEHSEDDALEIERCDGCSMPIGWDALDLGFCDCGLSCIFSDRAARLPVDEAFENLKAKLVAMFPPKAA